MGSKGVASGIIGLCIGVYVMVATIPSALTTYNDVCTSGFTTAQLALWPLIGLFIVIGCLYVIGKESGVM